MKGDAKDSIIKIKNRLEYLLTASPAVIYSCKPSGDFAPTFISSNISNQLGYTPQQFLSNPKFWVNHIHPEDKKMVLDGLSNILEKKHHIHEYRFMDKEGKYHWMYDELNLMHDKEGKPLEIVGYWIDITQRKNLEEMIIEHEKMAALGRVAAVVSHELNTPLTNIRMSAELLFSQLPSKYKEDFKFIRSEVANASNIVKRVLGFSRMDDLKKELVNLKDVINGAIENVRKISDTKNVTFQVKVSPMCTLVGDKYHLGEAFVNLIKNAVEARDSHKKRQYVIINAQVYENSIVVSINDTGIGINKKILDNITKSFFTTKPFGEGTGLGLTVTQWIIKEHGGNLSFESIKNVGTIVKVTFPRNI